MRQNIPYGESNFEKLRNRGFLYVDKTRFIESIERAPSYLVFLRPRRFGKSLFVSMLDCYYDRNSADRFEALFGNLYIGQHPTPLKHAYYVLKFNFSGITTDTTTVCKTEFTQKVIEGLNAFEERYGLTLTYHRRGSAATQFNSFLTAVRYKLKDKIYVLIDEYDHFANELLSLQLDTFKAAVTRNGFVRKWYEVLKEGTESIVDRIFITGVSPITLDSLTSGFNIATHLTTDAPYHALMGFTEAETSLLITQSGIPESADKLLPVLQRYYNGYQFTQDAKERLFNSDMVLYYLSRYQLLGKPPQSLIDTNIASDYDKIDHLCNIKNQREQNMSVIQEVVEGNATPFFPLTHMFSLKKDFTEHDFRSLLLYMGFLSIHSSLSSLVSLAIPNYVIHELYYDFFLALLKKDAEKARYQIDITLLQNAIIEIAFQGKIDPFLAYIEDTLSHLSNRDLVQFDEKHIKMIMLSYLVMGRMFYVKSEPEANRGYIDIALLKRVGVEVPYQAVIELKYIKKADLTEARLAAAVIEGRTQLARYVAAEELNDLPNLKQWLVVLSGTKFVHIESI